MKKGNINKLKRLRRTRLIRALKILLRNSGSLSPKDSEALDESFKEVGILSTILDDHDKPKRVDYRSVLFIILSTLAILFLNHYRLNSSHVTLDIKSNAINAKMYNAWRSEDVVQCNFIGLSAFDRIDLAPDRYKGNADLSVEVFGKISIIETHLYDSISIDIEREEHRTEMYLKKGSVSIEIVVHSGSLKLFRHDSTILEKHIQKNQSIEISGARSSNASLGLSVEHMSFIKFRGDSINLSNILVNELSFERIEGVPKKVVSGISSGKIKIRESKLDQGVNGGDLIILKPNEGEFINLKSVSKSLFMTSFDGKVEHFEVNNVDVRPTFLQFIYYNDQYSFFWITGTFLIGLIWNINNLFREK